MVGQPPRQDYDVLAGHLAVIEDALGRLRCARDQAPGETLNDLHLLILHGVRAEQAFRTASVQAAASLVADENVVPLA